MIRIKFQTRLDELKERLLVMAGLAEQAVQRSMDAYHGRDLALCKQVEESERAINALEREIHARAIDLLATEQPMAVDLRFILAVTRINVDLERVGDQAVAIVRRAREMADSPETDLPVDILRIGALAAGMVRRAVGAFAAANATLAGAVLALDDEVDDLNRAAFQALSERIQARPESTPHALHALLVSRNLERIGDHATNIAEEVIFWVAGTDVRHGGMRLMTGAREQAVEDAAIESAVVETL